MKITIIWAWAAGMMAAATLLEKWTPGSDIILIDKNLKIGVKVAMTGGGRCNVTTSITERKVLFSKYVRGADFLKSAFETFWPRKVYQWFESQGLPLYTQEDHRVFPRSNKWQDVVEVFESIFRQKWVQMRLWEGVKDVQILPPCEGGIKGGLGCDENRDPLNPPWQGEDQQFLITTDKWSIQADRLMIATGWNAYTHTGSSGDWYAFAQSLGHTITPLGPSLTSFEVTEDWCKDLSGLSLQNAKLSVNLSPWACWRVDNDSEDLSMSRQAQHDKGKNISVTWALLFTHFGISGPAVFALSAYLAHEKIGKIETEKLRNWEVISIPLLRGGWGGFENHLFNPLNPPCQGEILVWISLDAGKDFQSWDNDIRIACEKEPLKQVKNILSAFLPHRIADFLISLSWIDKECLATHFPKEKRKRLVHLLTGQLMLTLINRRPGDEFVTAGWVKLTEVDQKTMQSKIIPWLYFWGEVLDIDGVTGGFNLQAAWATGRVVGEHILI